MSIRPCLPAVFISTVALLSIPAFAQTTHPWTVGEIFTVGSGAAESLSESQWTPDGTRLSYRLPDGALGVLDARTGDKTVLTPADKLHHIADRPVDEKNRDHRARYSQKGYFWSPDGKQVLFDEDGTLWLDNLAGETVKQVGDTGQGSGDDVQWAPDGKSIAYIHEHNLYVLHPGSGSEPIALTHTTDPNLHNGEVDWVYLEELKVRTNYSWSPDGAHLAYVQMDETHVPTFPITDWIPNHATVDEQKYPQAGDPNPGVRLGIVSSRGGETRWITLPGFSIGNDYIPRSGWLDANTVWIETVQRDHKHLDFWFADIRTGQVKKALALQDTKFFDENYDVEFFKPGNMLMQSWRDGYTHIYHYSYNVSTPMSGGLKLDRELERGTYDATDVLSVDGGTVYYASNEGDPRESQVWAVGLDGQGKRQVTHGAGVHKASFADGHGTFTDDFSDHSTPTRISVCTAAAGDCKVIADGHIPAGHTMRAPVQLELKAADGVTTLYATLLLPADKTERASIPLINNPYGGPGTMTVQNKWAGQNGYFDQLLAEHGFAVLHIDNRGMGGRGRAFTQACYHDFGKIQLADQLAVIDQVLAKYPQLDAKRLGWWGWSWGGTFTLNALGNSDRFRAGVSVAPVTDFHLYDSIYTERYMGLPSQEAAAYDAAAVQRSAAHLHGHLLIAHGTGDDNVHIMNTVQYIQKLIDAGQPYDLQIFPRKTHSIAGKEARTELYSRILRHFEMYLAPETPVQ